MINRSGAELKGKNTPQSAKGEKEKTRREASRICFPNAVTFLAGARPVLAKGVWEGGVAAAVVEG